VGTLEISINHCLFLYHIGNIFNNFPNSLVIQNSIFMVCCNPLSGSEGTFFYNNIFYPDISIPPSGSFGSGNMTNTDPLLVNYSVGVPYSPSQDYDVQPGSPAIGAATDGTDIGVHGGSAGFSENGEVLIVPIVRQITINNSTVAPGGTIDVLINAGKPHTN
jgi:hypothetical protein